MHRSGTSAVTRLLNILGADVSDNLLQGHKDVNQKGFWENKAIIDLHDEILGKLSSTWFDFRNLPHEWWLDDAIRPYHKKIVDVLARDFRNHQLIVIKDPRLCRLLPIWLHALENIAKQISCILVMRNPLEVVNSLVKRNGFDSEMVMRLWLAYVLESECYSRGLPRVIVEYSSILADWQKEVDHISNALDIKWPMAMDKVCQLIAEDLDSSLRHHYADNRDPERLDHIAQKALTVYDQLISKGYLDDINLNQYDELTGRDLADLAYRTNVLLFKKSQHFHELGKKHASALRTIQEKNQELKQIKSHWAYRILKQLFVLK